VQQYVLCDELLRDESYASYVPQSYVWRDVPYALHDAQSHVVPCASYVTQPYVLHDVPYVLHDGPLHDASYAYDV
jgi:hypothetical protein